MNALVVNSTRNLGGNAAFIVNLHRVLLKRYLMIEFTDPENNVSFYEYDDLNRKIKEISPMGKLHNLLIQQQFLQMKNLM